MNGKNVAEHIIEIIEDNAKTPLTKIAEVVALNLSRRLETCEFASNDQTISILLLYSDKGKNKLDSIALVNINLNNSHAAYSIENYEGIGAWCVIGDPIGRNAMQAFLSPRVGVFKGMSPKIVSNIIQKTVEAGIANCGFSSRFPANKTCCGPVKLKRAGTSERN